MNLPSDPTLYSHWVGIIVAIGIAIDSLEILYSRHEYTSQGILSWDILKLDSRFVLTGRSAWVFRCLLGSPGYLVLISFQLLLAVAIIAHVPETLLPLCLTGILGIKLLSHLRNVHGGLDGSDQMQIIIFSSLAVFYWVTDLEARMIALWFIAAQSMLSYFAAGIAKLASPIWRSGDAIVGIMATDHYGNQLLSQLLRKNHHLAAIVCWSVILFECLAPTLVFAGPTSCLVFLGCGFIFHSVIAVMMGLNTFLWSFGATYPAVIFLATFF
jgi:hypothetical protein